MQENDDKHPQGLDTMMQEAATEALWDVKQTANWFGISRSQLYALTSRGEGPPAYRVGSVLRFHPAEVRDWLTKQAVAA